MLQWNKGEEHETTEESGAPRASDGARSVKGRHVTGVTPDRRQSNHFEAEGLKRIFVQAEG